MRRGAQLCPRGDGFGSRLGGLGRCQQEVGQRRKARLGISPPREKGEYEKGQTEGGKHRHSPDVPPRAAKVESVAAGSACNRRNVYCRDAAPECANLIQRKARIVFLRQKTERR